MSPDFATIERPAPLPIETLTRAQDDLMQRLLDGRITIKNLRAAYRLHTYTLTRAGYKFHEAEACFWDCVLTARRALMAENAQL